MQGNALIKKTNLFIQFVFENLRGILKVARLDEKEIEKNLVDCQTTLNLRIVTKLIESIPENIQKQVSESLESEDLPERKVEKLLRILVETYGTEQTMKVVVDESRDFLQTMLSVFTNHLNPKQTQRFATDFERNADLLIRKINLSS